MLLQNVQQRAEEQRIVKAGDGFEQHVWCVAGSWKARSVRRGGTGIAGLHAAFHRCAWNTSCTAGTTCTAGGSWRVTFYQIVTKINGDSQFGIEIVMNQRHL
jgi:hypothetical protein